MVGSRSDPPAHRAPADGGGRGVLGLSQLGRRSDEPFPQGERIDIAPQVQRPRSTVLFGGTPPRMLRLSRRGAELVSAFGTGPVAGAAAARLARRLTDEGIAIPRPSLSGAPVDVTVVVPVRDRPRELADCLASLGSRHRVVVVDDGSSDPEAVEAVCRAHGAGVVRRAVPGGPAAARNTGLRTVTSELVAFCDSDCLPGPGWIDGLAGHFVDPLVVGVAPRIVAAVAGHGSSPLDLGARPAPVRPGGAVPFVPAAAVVFRRAALGDGYHDGFRYGEDVDLVWRLVEAGWRIRYEPGVEVRHRDPTAVVGRLRRRFLYGTSAGPLERAHRGTIDHLVVGAGPACTVGTFLLGSPGLAALAWAVTSARLVWQLRPLGLGSRFALRLSAGQVLHCWLGLGRWCTTFGAPLIAVAALGRRARPARRALRILTLLIGSALLARRVGPDGGARRVLVDDCLGEVAYGAGVLTGCARARVLAPLVPKIGRPRAGAARAGTR
jgi:mycofactocin system glycosyltransferase